MTQLSLPSPIVRESFLEAIAEFRAEGRCDENDRSTLGEEYRQFSSTWSTPQGFADYTRQLRAAALEETPRPAGYVPATTFWSTGGSEYFGRIGIRHRLTPQLLEVAGHIGYHVRPSARRRGYATAMLRGALLEARRLGIERALLTCQHDNIASQKVIISCGGVLEDRRGNKLRYWIATDPI